MGVVWDALAAKNSFVIKDTNATRNRNFNLSVISKLAVTAPPPVKKRKEDTGEVAESNLVETHDYCLFCEEGGFLILCDHPMCPKVAHPDCARITKEQLKDNSYEYFCPMHSRSVLIDQIVLSSTTESRTTEAFSATSSPLPENNITVTAPEQLPSSPAVPLPLNTPHQHTPDITNASSDSEGEKHLSKPVNGADTASTRGTGLPGTPFDHDFVFNIFTERLSIFTVSITSRAASSLTPAILQHLRQLEQMIIGLEELDSENAPKAAASASTPGMDITSPETTSSAQDTVEQIGSGGDPLPFGELESIDQFEETYDEFDARLCRSNLFPRKVAGNGACFWLACLRGMKWLAKRNNTWAKATKVPATAMEMRQKVLDFMQTNLKTNWDEKGLSSMTNFETAIQAELPYGVLCGASDATLSTTSISSWFEAMRKEFSYTSLCCVQATSLCFDLVLKIFIQGSNAVEQYVTQDCLIQPQEMTADVNPDVCVCLCKRNRGGHFDPCEWVDPTVHAHNSATKTAKRKRRTA
jgi:hypothetical protein